MVAAIATMALSAPAAQAMVTSERATSEVQRWASPESFEAPYAFVEVTHEGRELTRTAITGCKGQYADQDVTVLISTCGNRWRVRASYVSMSRRLERFRIAYEPRRTS